MDEKIANKINHFRQLANSPANAGNKKVTERLQSNDSLSKAIRNAKEAAVFLSELDAIVKSAAKK